MGKENRQVAEVSGNVLATQANLDRIISRTGNVVHQASFYMEHDFGGTKKVKSIRLKGPSEPGGDWLVVVSVDIDGYAMVGFHRDISMQAALEGSLQRILNGGIKWKDDEYA